MLLLPPLDTLTICLFDVFLSLDPPLGMESGEITDNQASSSSHMGLLSVAASARLNLQLMSPSGVGAWCSPAGSDAEWLAVDLETSHVISAVSDA